MQRIEKYKTKRIDIYPRSGYNTITATDKRLSTYSDRKVSAMQFREQGKKIQCIRSTYDPATKRSHQKVIAAFDRCKDISIVSIPNFVPVWIAVSI